MMKFRRWYVLLFLFFCIFANLGSLEAQSRTRKLSAAAAAAGRKHDSPLGGGTKASSRRSSSQQRTAQAYATLLYGDEFLLGVRVLGKSIRDTGVDKDMVALVSDGVSKSGIELLEADGWRVERIDLLKNPNSKRPARFWGVYTKLRIFNMTDYEKVVYLDADTIVLRSIEDLFACQGFCANLKHSERLNSGVMVVEPSVSLFEDMVSKIKSTYSYTGGDQGFLNSYYPDFPNAHLFEPELSSEVRKSRPAPKMERLSTLYNADVGLFALANKWMVEESELRVMHYTLGPLKPWDWWTAWLLSPVIVWQDVRVTLEDALPGTGQGQTPYTTLVVRSLFLFPFLFLAFLKRSFLLEVQKDLCALVCSGSFCACARHLWHKYKPSGSLPNYSMVNSSISNGCKHQGCSNPIGGGVVNPSCRVPKHLGIISILVCFLTVFLSLGAAALLVPRQVMPWTGMVLTYEWVIFMFTLLFGKFLDVVYAYGRSTASSVSSSAVDTTLQYSASKGHSRNTISWDMETITYGALMVILAISIPAVPCVMGVSAILARVGLMVAVGFVLIAVTTYTSEHLAIHWFLRGYDEWIR